MKDRHNRETDKPMEPRPKAKPTMKEKDTSEERQYKDKSGENLPESPAEGSKE